MKSATNRSAVAALVAGLSLAACSSGGGSAAVSDLPASAGSPTADATASPSPSGSPTVLNPAVTAAYAAAASSLSVIARDVPAMATAADFRPDLSALNAALARARTSLAAERAARYPPDCTKVRAYAAAVHAAAAEALAARSRISARGAVVAAASRRVDSDRALVAAKAAALAALLKATGTVLPPSLAAQDISVVLNNARSAQAQAAAAAASAGSAGSTGAANAVAQDAKATDLARAC